MYARTTTLQSNTDSIDAGIANVRDNVMSELQGIDGYVGLSLLVDRASGRCIATTAWETEEAMRASDGRYGTFVNAPRRRSAANRTSPNGKSRSYTVIISPARVPASVSPGSRWSPTRSSGASTSSRWVCCPHSTNTKGFAA